MAGYRPRKPSGTSRFMLFCIAVWEYLFGGKFPFIDTDTVKWSRSERGYAAHSKPGRGGGGTGATTNFRGEWLASAQYAAGDEVVISLGANRGIYKYVAFSPSTGHEPWVGAGYWFKMSDGLGQWM